MKKDLSSKHLKEKAESLARSRTPRCPLPPSQRHNLSPKPSRDEAILDLIQSIKSRISPPRMTSSEYLKALFSQRTETPKSPQTQRVNRSNTEQTSKPPIARLKSREDMKRHETSPKTRYELPPKVPRGVTLDRRPSSKAESSFLASKHNKTRIEEYTIGNQIGQGAYAVVKFAVHKPTQKKVALKIYEKTRLEDRQKRDNVNREIQIIEKLDHPHIVQLYDRIDTANELYLAQEYVGGCSLHGYLKRRPNRRLDEVEVRRLFKEILAAIDYCHQKQVTHRDIKLENILLDEENNIKIIDFGFSTCFPHHKTVRLFCGTPSYMAPEIVARQAYTGPPVDVWALGVLLYVLLCGAFPFKGTNDKDLYRKIQRGSLVIPQHVSSSAKLLIEKLMKVDPRKRLTISQIEEDPWITEEPLSENVIENSPQIALKASSINGEALDMGIFCSIVRFIEKKLGYTDSELFQDLHNKNSRASRLYSQLKSRGSFNRHYSAGFR